VSRFKLVQKNSAVYSAKSSMLVRYVGLPQTELINLWSSRCSTVLF